MLKILLVSRAFDYFASMSLNKTMIETVAELRPFFNRRDVSANGLVNLLGKQRPTAMIGGMVLMPWDKRFETIIARLDPRNPDVLRQISFSCPEHPVCLGDLEEAFGPFTAEWNEKERETFLTCSSFDEEEAIESFNSKIEQYQLENSDQGLLLHQPDGSGTVIVPTSELLLPTFAFKFKEFERPPDITAKGRNANPLANFLGGQKPK